MQSSAAILEDNLASSYKAKHTLTKQYSNHAPWYLLEEVENYIHIKACTQMLIAALLLTAKTWKQQRPLLVGECITKLWFIQTIWY